MPTITLDKFRYGWLSPYGELYACEYSGHSKLAFEIAQSKGWIPKKENFKDSNDYDGEQILEYRNWIKAAGRSSGPIDWLEPDMSAPTQRQMDVLLTWEMESGRKIDWLDLYRD
jgi:hypothetical protein